MELGYSYSGLSGKSAKDFGSGKPFITYLNVYSNIIVDETDYQYVSSFASDLGRRPGEV